MLAHPHKANQGKTIEEEETRQAALAHRHYLSYECQYQQICVDRAAEKVTFPVKRA